MNIEHNIKQALGGVVNVVNIKHNIEQAVMLWISDTISNRPWVVL